MMQDQQRTATKRMESSEQVAAVMGPLCQLLAENPAIHDIILKNYASELFWLKHNIETRMRLVAAYKDSPEYQADAKMLQICTLAYQQALESSRLQEKLKHVASTGNFALRRQEILEKYVKETEQLKLKLAASNQNPQEQADINIKIIARQWAVNYENNAKPNPAIEPADAQTQGRRNIAEKIERGKEKLYKQLAENPQDSQKILARYDNKLKNLQADIAAKEKQQGVAYTNSISYDNDTTELQVGDQAYQQVYVSVTGQEPEWVRKLNQEVSVNQKRRAWNWFQLALSLSQDATPYLAKALNVNPILPRIGEPSLVELRAQYSAKGVKYGILEKSEYDRLKSTGSKNVSIVTTMSELKTALSSAKQEIIIDFHWDQGQAKEIKDLCDTYGTNKKIFFGTYELPPSAELQEVIGSAAAHVWQNNSKPVEPVVATKPKIADITGSILKTVAESKPGLSIEPVLAQEKSSVKAIKAEFAPTVALPDINMDLSKENPDKPVDDVSADGAFDNTLSVKSDFQSKQEEQSLNFHPLRIRFNLHDMIYEYFPKDETMLKIAEHLSAGKGECISYTTMWLYSKYLQSKQPDKRGGYNQDYDKNWYSNTIRKIGLYNNPNQALSAADLADIDRKIGLYNNPNQVLSAADIADIKKFAQTLDFLESPKYYKEGFRPADTRIHEVDNRLTTDGKVLHEQYKLAIKFNSRDHLEAFLESILHEGVSIYMVSSHGEVNNPGHFTGVVKHDNEYYYYDSMYSLDEIKLKSLKEVADKIDIYDTVGFIVGNFEPDYTDYPAPESILTANYPPDYKFTQEELEKGAMTAILVRSKESLKFYLDHGLSPQHKNQYGVSLIQAAVLANDQDSVKMLIELGVDPNDCSMMKTTCLHLAAIKGFPKVAEALLADPRTKIKQKDGNKTTAFEIARKRNCTKTAEQIKTEAKKRSVFV